MKRATLGGSFFDDRLRYYVYYLLFERFPCRVSLGRANISCNIARYAFLYALTPKNITPPQIISKRPEDCIEIIRMAVFSDLKKRRLQLRGI